MNEFTYSIASDTANNKVNNESLYNEILSSPINIAVESVTVSADVLTIKFKSSLGLSEQGVLDSVVAAHDGSPLPQDEVVKTHIVLDAGEVTDRPYGWPKVTATKNSTTTHDFLFDEGNLKLRGGVLYTKNSEFGDRITAYIVDKDFVYKGVLYPSTVDDGQGGQVDIELALPNGVELVPYAKNYPVDAYNNRIEVRSEYLTNDAVPLNSYFRVEYTSVGTVDDVELHLGMFTYRTS